MMATPFERNKAKIEAFLESNLTTILPHLCSEGLISPTEDEEIEHTPHSRKAHTLTKILESKIANTPEIYVTLKKVLKIREGEIEDMEDKLPHTIPIGGTSLHGSNECPPQKPKTGSFAHPEHSSQQTDTHSVHIATGSVQQTHVKKQTSAEIKKSHRKGSRTARLRTPKHRDIEFSSNSSHRTVGHKGATIIGEGIQLRIPPRAIEKGEFRSIFVQGCIDGPFELPEDVQLASPVFLVECRPTRDLKHEVTLRIEHFVHLKSWQDCAMIVLLTSQQEPTKDKHGQHWKFEISDRQPQCYPNFIHGEVQLTHFSFLCFGIRRPRREDAGKHMCLEYRHRVCLAEGSRYIVFYASIDKYIPSQRIIIIGGIFIIL